MALDLTDIREALAANMHTLLHSELVKQVSPWLLDNPTLPCLQVAGVRNIEYDQAFQRGGDSLFIVIEAAIGRATDVGAQKTLDRLLAASGPTSLKAAVEADTSLTSRYNVDDGLRHDFEPACDDLQVETYEGQARFTFPTATDALLATWIVQVEITP
jgi:hypothetical protein